MRRISGSILFSLLLAATFGQGRPVATALGRPVAMALSRPIAMALSRPVAAAKAQQFFLIVGTYTNTGTLNGVTHLDSTASKGIYVYRFDAGTGRVKLLSHTEGVCNPSFLTIAPDGHHVYACTESRMANAGSVSAFDLDKATGQLKFINKVPSGGDNPAYLSVDGGSTATGGSSARWVAVANYTGGSFSVCGVRPDGGLSPAVQRLAFAGHGVNPQRQEKSHVHSVVFSPDQRQLYVQDLGLDRISAYPFHGDAAVPLDTINVGRFTTTPGSGPRHLVFGPGGRFAYLIEEMGGMVDVFAYDAATGRLDSVQRIAAHEDTAAGPFRSADIHLTPEGDFLYTSNRAESTLTIFSVDRGAGRETVDRGTGRVTVDRGTGRETVDKAAGSPERGDVDKRRGTLERIGYEPVFGKEPRNFAIDPTGNWLLAGDQDSNTIVIYHIDKTSGALRPLDERIQIPLPTCLRFIAGN